MESQFGELYHFKVKKHTTADDVNKDGEVIRTYNVKLIPADENTKEAISPITLKSTDASIFETYPPKALVQLRIKVDDAQTTIDQPGVPTAEKKRTRKAKKGEETPASEEGKDQESSA